MGDTLMLSCIFSAKYHSKLNISKCWWMFQPCLRIIVYLLLSLRSSVIPLTKGGTVAARTSTWLIVFSEANYSKRWRKSGTTPFWINLRYSYLQLIYSSVVPFQSAPLMLQASLRRLGDLWQLAMGTTLLFGTFPCWTFPVWPRQKGSVFLVNIGDSLFWKDSHTKLPLWSLS